MSNSPKDRAAARRSDRSPSLRTPRCGGLKLYAQVLEQDPNSAFNVAFSPGLEIVLGY